MSGQRQVEPLGVEDMHTGPAGECNQQAKQATDSKKNDGHKGVGLDQIFRRFVNA